MCMLSYYPPGKLPKVARLWNGADNNPDGHGWAIVTAGRELMMNKSMGAEYAIETFVEARAKHPEGPAMFHSRIATSGLVDVTGCHPFKVGTDNRTVLGHNGILFNTTGSRSDTRVFAEDMLPRMGSLDRPKKRNKIQTYLGRNNKVVVLTVNPRFRQAAYILNEDQGVWADGEWHSNYDFEGNWRYLKSSSKYGSSWAASEPIDGMSPNPCEICWGTYCVDDLTLECSVCGCCQDCRQFMENCSCYSSPSHRPGKPLAIESYEKKSTVVYDHKTKTASIIPATATPTANYRAPFTGGTALPLNAENDAAYLKRWGNSKG